MTLNNKLFFSVIKANDSESQLSGYLSRRTKKGWKRSWYVLKNSVLYIYKAPEDVLALETVPVIGYQVQEPVKVVQNKVINGKTHSFRSFI